MRYYPIYLDLHGRSCTVAGGGPVAERKVRTLLRAGANVHVISPEVTPRLALLAARKKIQLTSRAYRTGDLEGTSSKSDGQNPGRPTLVFAATNSPSAQALIRRDAGALGVPVNIASDARSPGSSSPPLFRREICRSPSRLREPVRRWLANCGAGFSSHLDANIADISNSCAKPENKS